MKWLVGIGTDISPYERFLLNSLENILMRTPLQNLKCSISLHLGGAGQRACISQTVTFIRKSVTLADRNEW